jgi:hypothetical protein
LRKKLSAAIDDDREEWEKRAEGDEHAMKKEETDPIEVALSLRERIALRRGSTRDLDAVIEMGKKGRVSLEFQQTALGNMFDAKGGGVSIDGNGSVKSEEKATESNEGGNEPEGGEKKEDTPPAKKTGSKFKMGNMLMSAHRKGDLEKAVDDMEASGVVDGGGDENKGKEGDEEKAKDEKEVAVVAKTLEISEEEKAMNGAPEGKLFVVEIIERDQLPKFDSDDAISSTISESIIPVLTNDEENEWNVEFDALTFMRRVLVHHPKSLDEEVVKKVIPGIEKCARNTRSVLAKNAVCCIDDLFLASNGVSLLEGNLEGTTLLAVCLLDSCATNMPKALRSVAALALDQATKAETTEIVLACLVESFVSRSSHKNKEVAVKAVTYTTKALESLQKHNSDFASSLNLEALLTSLHFGLNGKAPEGKKSAKQACLLVSSSKGEESYKEFIQSLESLSSLQKEELIKAGDNSSDKADEGKAAPMSPAEMRTLKMKELRAQAKAKAKEKNESDQASENTESTSL